MNFAKLKTLRVETKNHDFLGTILDLEIDAETGMVVNYAVGYDFMVMKQVIYLIARNQVLQIAGDTMVVEDNVQKIKKTKEVEPPKLIEEEAPTLNAEIK